MESYGGIGEGKAKGPAWRLLALGTLACYALGTAWFMISTHTGVWAALVSCVFPFLPGDALKIAAGAILTQKLRRLV